jgi:hypothetical protein
MSQFPSPTSGADAPAAPKPRKREHEGYTTQAIAERHEALWLALVALHKDTIALGAKKPNAPVTEPARIMAEGLLADCAPFIRQPGGRLPVAAPDLVGLALQLGQALALLEAWESRHTTWDDRHKCRVWNCYERYQPILRLKPPAEALRHASRVNPDEISRKLVKRIEGRRRAAYQQGYAAGLAARQGAPTASENSGPNAPENSRPALGVLPPANAIPAYPRFSWGE